MCGILNPWPDIETADLISVLGFGELQTKLILLWLRQRL